MKKIFLLLSLLLFAILQFAFFSSLPIVSHVDILLVSLIYLVIILKPINSFLYCLYIAILNSYFLTPYNLLYNIIIFCLLYLFIYILSRKIFSQFSIYSTLFITIGVLTLNELLNYLIILLANYFGEIAVYKAITLSSLSLFVSYILLNTFLSLLFFIILSKMSRVLNLAFIKNTK